MHGANLISQCMYAVWQQRGEVLRLDSGAEPHARKPRVAMTDLAMHPTGQAGYGDRGACCFSPRYLRRTYLVIFAGREEQFTSEVVRCVKDRNNPHSSSEGSAARSRLFVAHDVSKRKILVIAESPLLRLGSRSRRLGQRGPPA